MKSEKDKVQHLVSFSGGKDSTAMLIRMLELGMRVDRILFADTMYEFPEMYDYIDKVDEYIKRFGDYKIEILQTEETLEKWMFGEWSRGRNKGEIRGFPRITHPCYWNREAKAKILDKEGKGHYQYIGIASDEKHRQSKNKEEDMFVYPLIEWGWTEQDCLNYLEGIGLQNPLYETFDRLGCYWCPKQNVGSLEKLVQNYPDLWEKTKDMNRRIREINPELTFRMDLSVDEIDKRFKK